MTRNTFSNVQKFSTTILFEQCAYVSNSIICSVQIPAELPVLFEQYLYVTNNIAGMHNMLEFYGR
jgi:hypothetical protein